MTPSTQNKKWRKHTMNSAVFGLKHQDWYTFFGTHLNLQKHLLVLKPKLQKVKVNVCRRQVQYWNTEQMHQKGVPKSWDCLK
jgi:hypothetical protein